MAGRLRSDPARAEGLDRLRRTVRVRLRRQASDLAHDHSHAERVYASARRLAAALIETEAVDVDEDTLEAACLLHEIGRGAERRGEARIDATLRLAEEMLRADGLSELVWPVCDTLSQHLTPGRDPESAEARLLNDADVLEELGAIGLARAIVESVVAATPLLYDVEDPEAERRELDEATYLLDRFPVRHLGLAASCSTAVGRAEAERRAKVLAAYYKAFLKEAAVE